MVAVPVCALARRQLHTATQLRSDGLASRTGQTGAAVLGLGSLAYLMSKEIVVLHAETVVVAAVGGVTYGLVKKFGPEVGSALDAAAKEIEDNWNRSREKEVARLREELEEQASGAYCHMGCGLGREDVAKSISTFCSNFFLLLCSPQKSIKDSLVSVPAIFDIQLELNDMQRELDYRLKRHRAYEDVVRELNEVVAIESQQRMAAQMEMVAWLESEVTKSVAGKVCHVTGGFFFLSIAV